MNNALQLNASIVEIINEYRTESLKRDDLRVSLCEITGLNKYQVESAILDKERLESKGSFDLKSELERIKSSLGIYYTTKLPKLRKLFIEFTGKDLILQKTMDDDLKMYQGATNCISNWDLVKMLLYSPNIMVLLGIFVAVASFDTLVYLDYFTERISSHYNEPKFENSSIVTGVVDSRRTSYFEKVYIVDYHYQFQGESFKEYSFVKKPMNKGTKVNVIVDNNQANVSKIMTGSYTPGVILKPLSSFEIIAHIFMYAIFFAIAYKEWTKYQLYQTGNIALTQSIEIVNKVNSEGEKEAVYSFLDADEVLRHEKEDCPRSHTIHRTIDYDIVFYNKHKSILSIALGDLITCTNDEIRVNISSVEFKKKILGMLTFGFFIAIYSLCSFI